MPQSKHRRKRGGKAVHHPGRGKMTDLTRLMEANAALYDPRMQEAYEHLAPSRMAPELVTEYRKLIWKQRELDDEHSLDLPPEDEQRLGELEKLVSKAVPDADVAQYLVERHGYGGSNAPAIPEEYLWDPLPAAEQPPGAS